MKQIHALTLAMAVSAVVLTGCQYPNGQPNNTGTGALIGAGSGAAAGAVLDGHNAITGSIIGNQMDQAQAAQLRAQAPVTYVRVQQNQPLTVADVQALVRAHVSDDAIIAQIQNSQTIYHLSAQNIIDLHNAGASERLLNYLINTVNTFTPFARETVVMSDEPPPLPAQTALPPPGPGYVWVAGDWQWNGAGWVWESGRWVYPPWPGAVWVRGYWYRGPYGGWSFAPGHWR